MPKIPFHSHLSLVTLGILPMPFLALEKLQIRNKVNSLAFQVQFTLTTSTSPGQKRWNYSQRGLSDLVGWVWVYFIFIFFIWLWVLLVCLVAWHKFKLWACVEWVIFNKRSEYKLVLWMEKSYPCYNSSGFFWQNICLWFIAILNTQEL